VNFENKLIEGVLKPDFANFLYKYLLMRSNVFAKTLTDGWIPHNMTIYGMWGDGQVDNCFSVYADPAFEVVLSDLKQVIEHHLNLDLVETYSYERLYQNGAELKKHFDRSSCKYSATLNLGGDPWPIYLAGTEVNLKPGDILIYDGVNQEHWRNKFEGQFCGQVFLHYNDAKDPNANAKDGREFLGLPGVYKKR
jgi:hypothetical protein